MSHSEALQVGSNPAGQPTVKAIRDDQRIQVGVGYYATTPGGIQVWVPLYGWDGRA